MRFNTPDNIVLDNDVNITWKDKDAVPFFVLKDGKIVTCEHGTRHVDYLSTKFKTKQEQRKFINLIELQGRYWQKENAFAFWNIDYDSERKMMYCIHNLSKSPYTSKTFYNNKVYTLEHDKDNEWFSVISEKPERESIVDKMDIITYWFNSEKTFISRNYLMSEKKNNTLATRELTRFELLAATVYQIWADFFMNPKSSFDKFTFNDLFLFIDLKYHGRTSVKELFDYFHKHMRKKMIPMHQADEYNSNDMKYDNEFEELMGKLSLSDTEYHITYYENSNKALFLHSQS